MAAARSTVLVGLALMLLTTGLAGCMDPSSQDPPTDPDANTTPDPDGEAPNGNATRQTIAWTQLPDPGEVPEADAEHLMNLLERQVYTNTTTREPRYRTPGTQGHEDAIPILGAMLEEAGANVTREEFTVDLPLGIGEVNATNVYGVREGDLDDEIWLAAHWDSRAKATAARNDSRTDRPVLGANDGAAAVAVATYALSILPETNHTIRVALFDAEDQGQGGTGWIQGSSHAADALTAEQRDRIAALILVDMPGHDPLTIRREGRSEQASPHLTDVTFGVAERLEAGGFVNETGPPILDDHVPFLEKDVRAVDLIHLDENGTTAFPWTWHTPHDTPAHVSGASMAEVTRVVAGTAMAVDRGALPPGEAGSSR